MTETDRTSGMTNGVAAEAVAVSGYPLRLDREYHTPTHFWLLEVGDGRRRIGLDALTADTYGMLAHLVLPAAGTEVEAGAEFGSLEAAKFVGPLVSPLGGIVTAVNAAVLDDPELVVREPYDGGWLVEVAPGADDLPARDTVSGAQALAWFEQAVADHREKGLVAE
jgi:glycine cleavage system H protein